MLGVCHSAGGGWVLALRSKSGRPVCVEASSVHLHPLEGTVALGSYQIPLVLSPASPWSAFMATDSPSGPVPDLRRQMLQERDLCPQGGGSFNAPCVILRHIPGKGRIAV